MRQVKLKHKPLPKGQNIKIVDATVSNGVWTVKFKVWEGCYCTAKKFTVELEQENRPTSEDIRNKICLC